MNIYIISIVDDLDYYEIHYCTSWEKVIDFLRRAIEDEKSGIDENTIVDISVDILDEYFSNESKSIDRKCVKEFLNV